MSAPRPLPAPAVTESSVAELNAEWRLRQGTAALEMVLLEQFQGRIAVSSSFGAESAILLHLVSRIDRNVPVFFLETGMHFPETLNYKRRLVERFGLTHVVDLVPDAEALRKADRDNLLHRVDPDRCCQIRKVDPMEIATSRFDAWITGRKRHQNADRADLPIFEWSRNGIVKVNPLANWNPVDTADYIARWDLPAHPLVAMGFPSIGCMTCTSRVDSGEDARAGRWRGSDKTECGIHQTPVVKSSPTRP